jgi:hypothetical protein
MPYVLHPFGFAFFPAHRPWFRPTSESTVEMAVFDGGIVESMAVKVFRQVSFTSVEKSRFHEKW